MCARAPVRARDIAVLKKEMMNIAVTYASSWGVFMYHVCMCVCLCLQVRSRRSCKTLIPQTILRTCARRLCACLFSETECETSPIRFVCAHDVFMPIVDLHKPLTKTPDPNATLISPSENNQCARSNSNIVRHLMSKGRPLKRLPLPCAKPSRFFYPRDVNLNVNERQ